VGCGYDGGSAPRATPQAPPPPHHHHHHPSRQAALGPKKKGHTFFLENIETIFQQMFPPFNKNTLVQHFFKKIGSTCFKCFQCFVLIFFTVQILNGKSSIGLCGFGTDRTSWACWTLFF
jgi:hypothetical protein